MPRRRSSTAPRRSSATATRSATSWTSPASKRCSRMRGRRRCRSTSPCRAPCPRPRPSWRTAGGDLTPAKIGALFDRWPEALALGEKMDFVPVATGEARAHAIIAEALKRGRPVSGHVYGREFVAAYAASGVTDTHEAIDREIADDLLEAGVWIFLRGGPPTTPWHSLPQAIRAVTELGASPKRVAVCTDDRDAGRSVDVRARLGGCARRATRASRGRRQWSMGSLHGATRFGLEGEIGGLGGGPPGRSRADGRRPQAALHLVWRRTGRRGSADHTAPRCGSIGPLPISEGGVHGPCICPRSRG